MKISTLCLSLAMLFSQLHAQENVNCSLDEFLTSHGVSREQNAGHINTYPVMEFKAVAYREIVKKHPNIHTIAEIGFCVGHTSDLFLGTRPDVQVVSFDMMYHWFNDLGKDYIDLKYPGRHRLFKGDSLQTVPEFIRKNKGVTFDMILVDGGHEYHVALGDILNMRHLARPDTILIVDDTNFGPVNDAWEKCVADGIVEELERDSAHCMGWVVGRYLQFDE